MKPLYLVAFFLIWTGANALSADAPFVYDGGFTGAANADGPNDLDISYSLFNKVTNRCQNLNSEANSKWTLLSAASLLEAMLELKAFAEQRADKVKFSLPQQQALLAISRLTQALNLSYHPKQGQALVEFCKKEPAAIEKAEAFAKVWTPPARK